MQRCGGCGGSSSSREEFAITILIQSVAHLHRAKAMMRCHILSFKSNCWCGAIFFYNTLVFNCCQATFSQTSMVDSWLKIWHRTGDRKVTHIRVLSIWSTQNHATYIKSVWGTMMIWVIKLWVHRSWDHTLVVRAVRSVTIYTIINLLNLTICKWAWYFVCKSLCQDFIFIDDFASLSAPALRSSCLLFFFKLGFSSLNPHIWWMSRWWGRHASFGWSPSRLTCHRSVSSPYLLIL